MNTKLALTAFVMFAIMMGMSSVAPAFAGATSSTGGPPANERAEDNPPTIDCYDLMDALDSTSMSQKAKDRVLELAGCSQPG